MIEIRKIEETTADLFKDGVGFIGTITSDLQLHDVRIQIMEKKAEGYSITWKGCNIEIDSSGMLSCWPVGLFDILDNQVEKLLFGSIE